MKCFRLFIRASLLATFLVSLTTNFFAQGTWVWETGSGTRNSAGSYAAKGVLDPNNNPQNVYGANDFVDKDGNLWAYGGISAVGGMTDVLWKFDYKLKQWAWMGGVGGTFDLPVYGTKGVSSPTNNPTGRSDAATWVDKDGNFWLFGGGSFYALPGMSLLKMDTRNDLWKYDPVIGEWTWVHGPTTRNDLGNYGVLGVSSNTNLPPARRYTSCTWVDSKGDLWLFGGRDSNEYSSTNRPREYGDLWRYNIASNQWTWEGGSNIKDASPVFGNKGTPGTVNQPGARQVNASWIDGQDNLWLFGGNSSSRGGYLNDLWKYNPSTKEWTWMKGDSIIDAPGNFGTKCSPDVNTTPPALSFNRSRWKDDCGNFWFFGGLHSSGSYIPGGTYVKPQAFNTLWMYNPTTNEWVWKDGDSTPNVPINFGTKGTPSVTNNPGAAHYDLAFANEKGFWLFSGRRYNTALGGTQDLYDDMWRYIPEAPAVDFSLNRQCYKGTILFDGKLKPGECSNAKEYTWDFGDGSALQAAASPSHTFSHNGDFDVKLKIQSCTFQVDSFQRTITVDEDFMLTKAINPPAFCDSAFFAGNWYKTSGTYRDTAFGGSSTGCDSITEATLVINQSVSTNDMATICPGENMIVHGMTQSSSGVYVQTFTMPTGCDSTSTVVLDLFKPAIKTFNYVNCDSVVLETGKKVYHSTILYDTLPGLSVNGCDSILERIVQVNHSKLIHIDTVIALADNFTINSRLISTDGVYTDTLSTATGCDSVVTYAVQFQNNVVYIANAIVVNSPNEKSRIFKVHGMSVNKVELDIYDRWGHLVHRGNEWDGRDKDNVVPRSVYVYKAHISFDDGTTVDKDGTVTVLTR